jgi:hypothetical protein
MSLGLLTHQLNNFQLGNSVVSKGTINIVSNSPYINFSQGSVTFTYKVYGFIFGKVNLILVEMLNISGTGNVSINWGYTFTSPNYQNYIRFSNFTGVSNIVPAQSGFSFTLSSVSNINGIAVAIGF